MVLQYNPIDQAGIRACDRDEHFGNGKRRSM